MPIPIKRVAIIGAGPAGAIAIDALAREQSFTTIRVFERRSAPGGCWLLDPTPSAARIPDLVAQTVTRDLPLPIPAALPALTPKSTQFRFTETANYAELHTNIDTGVMSYSEEPMSAERSAASVALHGEDTPFRHNRVVLEWVQRLVRRKGYENLVEYDTTVERAVREGEEWVVTLRKERVDGDYWWEERFDAVVVATGHHWVPFVPEIPGLKEWAEKWGTVDHSKYFRDVETYRGKRIVIVGASISAMDMATDLSGIAETPIYSVVRGRYNPYFGDTAFKSPYLKLVPEILHVDPETRTVYFSDGSSVEAVDHILFGTGFNWTVPFLPSVEVRNNRIPGLYLHIFHKSDPTLAFVGANGGFTFRAFEWQAVAIARLFAGRIQLPPMEERERWETERIAYRGDGLPFVALWPEFEEYFEKVRKLAGDEGPGRKLPAFDREWVKSFEAGHQKRIEMWARKNKLAAEVLGVEQQM